MENYEGLFENTFSDVIKMACSKSRAPGAGSVSAMVAILGGSLGAMVANLTLGKPGYKEWEPEMENLLKEIEDRIDKLKVLSETDIMVYEMFLETKKLPRETKKEQTRYETVYQANLIKATYVPIRICNRIVSLFKLIRRVAFIGNIKVLSDVAVASILLEAAIRALMQVVEANLAGITGRKELAALKIGRTYLTGVCQNLLQETLSVVAQRCH
ncbi:MAG: cyclodeaminase/cyclohydrolase family protein [Deltaproteobacteria bacterium]|jgi:formiminotetrahydrofolate cyclodeaminase|nr:cyclodeaminase/cyclohydrolase family protein [Deltaproteobacteria bacterium]